LGGSSIRLMSLDAIPLGGSGRVQMSNEHKKIPVTPVQRMRTYRMRHRNGLRGTSKNVLLMRDRAQVRIES